ncbi:MAG: thiol reductant ABC exporter subunit CydC [Gammaproteobacteria bacterium]|jgi:ATP-binding cassette subfamily C protein CydC|nr:thiol reductant ABC exporter subunit CydC [Gammaproteobacteria bacterium]
MRFRRLIRDAWREQWRWLALGILLMLGSTAASLVLLGLSGWLITASALAGLGIIAALDIFTPGGGIRLAAITRTLARYGERLATHRATLGLLASIRLGLMRRLLRLDEVQLRRLQRGDTLNRFTSDVESLDHLFSGVAGPLATATLTTMGVSLALFLLASVPAAAVVLGLGVVGLAITAIMGRAGQAAGRTLALEEPRLRRQCSESLEGLKSLLAESRVDDFAAMVEKLSESRVSGQERLDRLDALGRALINAAGFTTAWLVLLILLGAAAAGTLSGPVAVLGVIVALGLNEAWQALPAAWRQLTRTRLAADRVGELAGLEPALAPCGEEPVPPGPAGMQLSRVRFTWPQASGPVFESLDLDLEAGERLLVTGPSGSGKTTLALLLMRQVDPDAGAVRLGGKDLRRIDPDALRRHVGYLPQQPVVFADTLAANLRVAAPGAQDTRLRDVLQAAGLGAWLETLEQGLETWLDGGGANLSGGELRRIGLARLMLVDPAVVILDEPTTGLDQTTALALAAGLEQWLNGRTTVMISHEPQWLPRYDRELCL